MISHFELYRIYPLSPSTVRSPFERGKVSDFSPYEGEIKRGRRTYLAHIKVIHRRHDFSFLLVFGLENNTEITTGSFIFQGIYVYRLKNLTGNDILSPSKRALPP